MKNRRSTYWAVGVLVIIAAGVGIWLGVFPPWQEEPVAQEIKIGVILPESGDYAAYGIKERNGVQLAIEQAQGRLGDRYTLTVIYEDSQAVPTPAVNAMQKLITVDGVDVVIGCAFSSPTLAIVPIADRNEVVLMSPSASNPDLSGSSPYFFRVWPSDTAEGARTAEIGYEQLGLRTFAVFYGNNDYAVGLKDVFIPRIEELGGEIVAIEAYNEGDTDFRTQLAQIAALAPDGIYMAGYYREFARILNQARELGIEAQFLSCGTFPEPEILELAGDAAEGVVYVQPYFNRESSERVVQDFVRAYEEKFGIETGVYAAHGYDAAAVVCHVIEAGNTTSEEIRTALLELSDFPGVTGETTFIEGGDVIKPLRVMTVENGQFVDF